MKVEKKEKTNDLLVFKEDGEEIKSLGAELALRRRSEEVVKMQDRLQMSPTAVMFCGETTEGRELRSTIKTDKDKEYADKDMEHEICVSSWNINKSSDRYDFLRDVAQCRVDVATFQETQKLARTQCCC